jgi:hypothetical protein
MAVWIAEDEEPDGVSGDWLHSGTFYGHLERDEELVEEFEGLSLEEALAWGRARSDRVFIRYGESDYFSAGETPEPSVPTWPPAELPEFTRRRPQSQRWKDRTESDALIDWDVELLLEPAELPIDRAARDRAAELVAAIADDIAASWDSRAVDDLLALHEATPEGGAIYAPVGAFALRLRTTAPTASLAVAAATERCRTPAGWTLTGRAEPA